MNKDKVNRMRDRWAHEKRDEEISSSGDKEEDEVEGLNLEDCEDDE